MVTWLIHDRRYAKLSCMSSEEMWFATVSTYGDMGPFLCIVSLAGIILYFVTSSDSGTFLIQYLLVTAIFLFGDIIDDHNSAFIQR